MEKPFPPSAYSTLLPMFTMQHFFRVIPHEAAGQRYAAQNDRLAIENFCRGFITTAVDVATQVQPAAATRRMPPRRPRGLLNIVFVRYFVKFLADKAVEASIGKVKKVYRKWSDNEREMVLHMAEEKGSDGAAISFLATLFPSTFARLRESHIRYFRKMATRAQQGAADKRGTVRKCSPCCLVDIVQCIQAHVDCHLEFRTVEIRCAVLAMMEERHADVVANGFVASISWLNVLMRETMKLPMRKVSTKVIPPAPYDEAIRQHRLVLVAHCLSG